MFHMVSLTTIYNNHIIERLNEKFVGLNNFRKQS